MTMSDFTPTHKITLADGTTELVQLVDGSAYTRAEWDSASAADYERQEDGSWTFQGEAFAGYCERVIDDATRWADEHGFDNGMVWQANGVDLVDALAADGIPEVEVEGERNDGVPSEYTTGYQFPDGSLIWLTGDCWDIVGIDGIDGSGEYTVR
jgi:hypothetical protein